MSTIITETDQKIFSYVQENQDYYVKRLAEVVAIPSVSGDAEYRQDVVKMGKWLEAELISLGATLIFD